ncbi:MAG: protein kinase [Kofleriaceae bacterium]
MPSSKAAPSLLAGGDVVLDRYRVLEQIAAGGHSLVFRGEDTRLARPVCIKVFSGLGGKSGVGRTTLEHFVQEAFALSRLTHPNTLRIYDFGHLDVNKHLDTGRIAREIGADPSEFEAGAGGDDGLGLPLQVCEYMNGGTLSTMLREHGPQSPRETLRVISAMCEALAEAHNLGIVHRDIKPQNILFASVGDARLPKLADFGIAKWSNDQESASPKRADDTQIVAGQKLAMYSPSWAAPEQLAGQPVGAGTDIYSLAALAIYMLTGRAIFSDEDVYAGYKKRRYADTLVREALAPLGLPPVFLDVLIRALAFDPNERTARISEFSSALTAAAQVPLEGAPVVQEALHAGSAGVPVANPPGPSSGVPVAYPPGPPSGALTAPSLKSGPVVAPGRAQPPTQPPPLAETAQGAPPASLEIDPSSRVGDPLDRLADGTRYRVYGGSSMDAVAPPLPPSPPLAPPTASTPAPRGAWFALHQQAPSGAVRRLAPTEQPTLIGERRLHFIMAPAGVADLTGPQNARVRITLLPSPDGRRIVHIKSLSCFVAHHGGRPSPAIHCDRDADVELVTPRAQPLAFARLTLGHPGPSETPFLLGAERISVARGDLADPILFDFGPGSEAYLVYTRGRLAPKLPRRGH